MHYDALTLACVAAEAAAALVPSRVQNLLLTGEQSVGLELYTERQRRYLLLSADPQESCVYLSSEKLRRGTDTTPPLLLLLRKYVRGSLLTALVQPDPTERLLWLDFAHPNHGGSRLVVELIGAASNLILLNPAGRILDCLRRVAPTAESTRVLLPGRAYLPPPAQGKLSPLEVAAQGVDPRVAALSGQSGPLWKALVATLAGTSPTLAREIAWRAAGDAGAAVQAVAPSALLAAVDELWAPVHSGRWQPGLVQEGEAVVGYAPYPLHFRGQFHPLPTLSQALERYRGSAGPESRAPRPVPDPYGGLRRTAAAQLEKAERRLFRLLAALAGDEPAPGEPAQLRTQAEWLLALSSQIQAHQLLLEVPLEGGSLQIRLDPQRTSVEQAQRMFKRAAKLERAAQFIPQRRAQLEADLAFLGQLRADLALAQNQPEIAAVQEELRLAGLVRASQRPPSQKASPSSGQPLRFLSEEGFAILVGRNARQNERVTFGEANGEDLWLHVRDVPGAHVVVRSGGQPVSADTVLVAAQLAAYHSTLRGERAAAVAVTRRRAVSRRPGGRPGQVTFRDAETVLVAAEMPQI